MKNRHKQGAVPTVPQTSQDLALNDVAKGVEQKPDVLLVQKRVDAGQKQVRTLAIGGLRACTCNLRHHIESVHVMPRGDDERPRGGQARRRTFRRFPRSGNPSNFSIARSACSLQP